MPEWFKHYLEGLPQDLADELLSWLDGYLVAQDCIEIISDELERRKKLGI